jgi:eukaryotic-like serine/threonine-protein kinase
MPAFSSTDELTVFSSALSGQYEVEREIGRGGMGVVYLARDLRLDRMVAIKTLPLHLANDPSIRERFLREARTAARLSHPNIVPVYRSDEVGGQVFFVMGFVDGDSLAAKLASATALSPKRALPILRDVAAALGYAHSHGVIHRDVKTENILLDTVSGRAMVTDFGIARMGEAAPLTATGQVLGTVYYLSPEQVAGEAVDARSDVYALGVVGYAMLAGQFPFDGPLASAVLVAHVNKQPVPLAAIAPHVPASLASIIDRCLAKNPAHRYQTCAELDAALASAETDAYRVTAIPAVSKSPLVSDTEAQQVFQRAAEIQDMTRPYARPEPLSRDATKDAARREGFKTGDLREAAREAGIAPEFVQHALVERGLARATGAPAVPSETVFTDLTAKPTWWGGEPTRLSYEAIVPGEVAEEDFDIIVDSIRSRAGAWGEVGDVNTVGKSLTWSSQSKSGRKLQVTLFPRNGKTTIRVFESISETYAGLYGGIMGGLGGGGGGMLIAIMKKFGPIDNGELFGRGLDNPNIQLAFILWFCALVPFSYLVARFSANTLSTNRQDTLKTMLHDLVDKARESMGYKR